MSSARFAQAQERLASHRASRERTQALDKRLLSQSTSGSASTTTTQYGIVSRVRALLQSTDGTSPAFRVGQVDAELLDEELLDLLKGQVGDALRNLGSHWQDDWNAEILLGLRTLLFKFTIWDHDATYGAALQNLRYTDARKSCLTSKPLTRWQKGLYGLVTVGGKYAWSKWEDWLLDNDNGQEHENLYIRRLARWSDPLLTTHSIVAFTSFLVFLVDGKYRTLLDRVLRMRLIAPTNQVSREVSFEYLNRQLVWHAFTEFLLFMLPLVGINRWRKWFAKAWRKTKALTRSEIESDTTQGELAHLPEQTCAICYADIEAGDGGAIPTGSSPGILGSAQTDITNPYETTSCGCVYCFVCLAGKIEAEDGDPWTCLRCGESVRGCKPWTGDVLGVSSQTLAQQIVADGQEASGSIAAEKHIEHDCSHDGKCYNAHSY